MQTTETLSSEKLTPTFVGIGPGKCGTTWLYNALANHPQVCVSTAKETLYFSDHHSRGFEWYQRFFKSKSEERPLAIGEVSNTYIFDREVAQRIAEELPDAKIIYNLREPIERAFSHYLFLRRSAVLSCDFEEAIERRPDLLSRGKYAEHLRSFHECFDPSKRLGLFYDDLKADANAYAATVFRFLGVEPDLYEGDPTRRVLQASAPRSWFVARTVVKAAQLTRHLGYPDLVSKVKHSRISRLIFRPFRDGEKPTINPETRERLKPYYYDDLDELSKMTGRDVRAMWGY